MLFDEPLLNSLQGTMATIDPYSVKKEAIDENGMHWSAEMDNKQERWLVYTKLWTKDPQQPLDL